MATDLPSYTEKPGIQIPSVAWQRRTDDLFLAESLMSHVVVLSILKRHRVIVNTVSLCGVGRLPHIHNIGVRRIRPFRCERRNGDL